MNKIFVFYDFCQIRCLLALKRKGPAAPSSVQVSYAAVAGKLPQGLFGTCVNNVLSAKRPGLKAQDAYVPYPGLKAGAPTVHRKRRDYETSSKIMKPTLMTRRWLLASNFFT